MTNILLPGNFLLGCFHFRRSPAPSPVPLSSTLHPSAPSTPPPQAVPIAIPAVTTPTTTTSADLFPDLIQRSQERMTQINAPQTRTEFKRKFGQKVFDKYKWRWDGAGKGERR
jgi:hypothetical protein